MPTYKRSDLWKAKTDLLAITTNGLVSNVRLVMGAGAAKQAAERFPYLPIYVASNLGRYYPYLINGNYLYGFIDLGRPEIVVGENGPQIGLFQSKLHPRDPSRLDVIAYSAVRLYVWCHQHPESRVACNLPGIGLGGLKPAQVKPLLAALPNTVTFYYTQGKSK